MKALIIDSFNNYDIRTKFVYKHFLELGYDTTIITSDFSHGQKQKVVIKRENTIVLNVIAYKKNLSFKRIKSHLNFSKQAYSHIKTLHPDLIYCLLPLNSLAKVVKKYKRTNNSARAYFDIFDLWPESLPKSKLIKSMLFGWRNMRNKNIKCADLVFLECSYYKQFLPKNINYETLYLCKDKRRIEYSQDFEIVNFLYLGSINNIIDIENIVLLLAQIQEVRNIHLHIIGGGESEKLFLEKLNSKNISHTFWGKIYDDAKKDEIISLCHFGINMYKSGLCIGLTMKSLEYFSRGLPLLNCNIYDTTEIINKNRCGINVQNGFEEAVSYIRNMTYDDWLMMHENCVNTYDNYFSPEILSELLKRHIWKYSN